MRLQVPPAIPYAVGAALVLFGLLRAKYLGAPKIPAEKDPDNPTADLRPVRGKEQKRHIAMGAVWIVLGLFLVVSTILQVRRGR
jgi:hypothetical protein